MMILSESEIRELVDPDQARAVVADGFRALHRGDATLADVISLPFNNPAGAAHIKAGHLHHDAVWTAKISADFYPDHGAAARHSGLMLVLSSVDGSLVGLLIDNGFLTEVRTGAAGAIAADLLARTDARTVAIIGAGSQARYQLEALMRVRHIKEVRIASRSAERARALADESKTKYPISAKSGDSVEQAVWGADIVITTTPSRTPLIEAGWLEAGTHVTAIGSDEPYKQELAPEVLARAAIVAVDDRGQAARMGELHHAIESGLRSDSDVVTLGELLEGQALGRVRADDVTVADLTGVGVQDAAIASMVLREATRGQAIQLESDGSGPAESVIEPGEEGQSQKRPTQLYAAPER